MIQFAKEDELHFAVVQIEIKNTITSKSEWSTGWLASELGHVISCGHVFKENTPHEIYRLTASLHDHTNASLEIIEIGSNSSGMDYSILKIDPELLSENSKLLRILNGLGRVGGEQKVIGCGFPYESEQSEYFGMSVPWTGTITPGYPIHKGKSYFKISCDDDSIPDGHSGGPVLLRRNSKTPAVMGIQILAEATMVRYALPVSHLREYSNVFREILALQDPWLKLGFLKSLKAHSARESSNDAKEKLFHYCMALYDSENFKLEHKVRLQDLSSQANHESKQALAEILQGGHTARFVYTKLHSEKIYRNDNIELKSILNRDIFDDDGKSRLRSVINVSDETSDTFIDADLSRHSHLVIVDYSKSHKRRSIEGGFPDLRICEPEFEPESAIAAVCALIHDIDLDSGFFYSIPLLPAFFSTADQRKLFSQEKANFLKQFCEFDSLYGITTDFGNLPYVPFAGVFRNALNGVVDRKKVRALWLDFLWHLFRPGHNGNGLGGKHQVSDIGGLEKLILARWPQMGGRLSIASLKAALGKRPSPLTSLRFFVLCIRSPVKNERATASMRQVFSRSKPPSPGQFVVIDGIDVLGLAGISPYVEIMPFEFRKDWHESRTQSDQTSQDHE